jgi:hypothetical protein
VLWYELLAELQGFSEPTAAGWVVCGFGAQGPV